VGSCKWGHVSFIDYSRLLHSAPAETTHRQSGNFYQARNFSLKAGPSSRLSTPSHCRIWDMPDRLPAEPACFYFAGWRRGESTLASYIGRSIVCARMIWIPTGVARSLFKTAGQNATPCSVNAIGLYLMPPQLEVTNCDFKFLNSPALYLNMEASSKLIGSWVELFL
jgi:hypothetical protein